MIEDMGFELVQVRMMGGARRTLQIMVEPQDKSRGMTVDDCADLSHAVSAVIDVADPITGAYALEISSPGIDRPLVRIADFDRFVGHVAKIELQRMIDGRRRFKGRIVGTTNDGNVTMSVDAGEVSVDFKEIRKAKLELTDELLAAHQNAFEASNKRKEDRSMQGLS